jgi:hypothetical protein
VKNASISKAVQYYAAAFGLEQSPIFGIVCEYWTITDWLNSSDPGR